MEGEGAEVLGPPLSIAFLRPCYWLLFIQEIILICTILWYSANTSACMNMKDTTSNRNIGTYTPTVFHIVLGSDIAVEDLLAHRHSNV